jgi:hypothetical protein
MYTKIFFSNFLNILKYDFEAVGASTPVSQSGYPGGTVPIVLLSLKLISYSSAGFE